MKNLKILRKNNNFTLQKLANELSISPQVLSRYEREERQADYETLKKIAIFFDVSIDYLLGASTYYYPDKIKELKNAELTLDEKKLLDDFRSLPRSERNQASEYVHYLAHRRGIQNKNA